MRGVRGGGGKGAGYSLAELVVALALFQVGLLAVAGWVLLAQEVLLEAELTQRAALEAEALADSLVRGRVGGEGRVSKGWGELLWEGEGGGGSLVVRGVTARQKDTLVRLVVWRPGGDPGE